MKVTANERPTPESLYSQWRKSKRFSIVPIYFKHTFQDEKKCTLGNDGTPLQSAFNLLMRTGMGRRQHEDGDKGGGIWEIKVRGRVR